MEEGAASKRGVKRLADESNLSDDQRFTKRFNLLNLGRYATAITKMLIADANIRISFGQ